jgi:hypothetical protein
VTAKSLFIAGIFLFSVNGYPRGSCAGGESNGQFANKLVSEICRTQNPFGLDGDDLFSPSMAKSPAAYSCLKDIGSGVWNATGGQVEMAGQIISDPKAAWDQGAQAFAEMKRFLLSLETELTSVLGNLGEIDKQLVATIVCSTIGEIGAGALVSALTGGGGLPLMTAKAIAKLKKLQTVASLIGLVSKGNLQLTKKMSESLQKLIRSHKNLSADESIAISSFSRIRDPDLALEVLQCAL